jgi:hypothetical protein
VRDTVFPFTGAAAEFMSHFEVPDVPSPRTLPWSVHNRKELNTWRACHESMRIAAATYTPAVEQHKPRLVLFGDSITESWRGTSYCKTMPRTRGVPGVLNSTLAKHWPSPLPLAISADCTQHLLWRLQAGEFTPLMKNDPWLNVNLLIGTNNLGHGHSVGDTTRGILAVASYLLNATRTRLLINALLPRGDKRKRRHSRTASSGTSHYTDDVVAVNSALEKAVASHLQRLYPSRVSYVDCGAPFYTQSPAKKSTAADLGLAAAASGAGPQAGIAPASTRPEIVRRDLMPDRLHPNAAGHELWGACIVQALHNVGWV